MIAIEILVVAVSVGMVTSEEECPNTRGPINNCCSLGYNNSQNWNWPGIYTISNFCGVRCSFAHVYCDTRSGGGGWTVIHRRQDGSVNFTDRDWVEYEDGFGINTGEFWMGLRSMHCLTSQGDWELRIDFQLDNGTKSYLHYKKFAVGSPTDQYKLTISGYDTIGLTDPFNSAPSKLNGKVFSSRDRKNDQHPDVNCGLKHGGWWHVRCAGIRPNDRFEEKNIRLNSQWHIYTFMEMKIRPLNCIE